ncbi:MAG: CvpA family protein [Geminicoccaceae bacterium]
MNDLPITLFDIIVAGIILLSTLLALSRGAVREILGLLSWIGAIVVAVYAFAPVRPMVTDAIGNELLADAATVAIVFFVPFLVLKIVTGLIGRAVSGSFLGPLDKLLGVVFGAARGVLIVCAAYLVGTAIIAKEQQPDWIMDAKLQPSVANGADWLAQFLPPGILDGSKAAATEAAARAAEEARRVRDGRNGGSAEGGSGETGYGELVRQGMDALIQGKAE